MNKLKRIFAFVLALAGVLSLAACQQHFDATLELVATRDTIEANASFAINDDIIDGKAVPHAKLYEIVAENDEKFIKDQNLTLNGKHTAGSTTFEKLEADKEYNVYLYIKLDNKDNLIESKKARTSKSGQAADDPFKITNAQEFQQMGKDPDGFYELANDIDFEGNVLDDQFTSSNKFEGSFNGNGHTISNFKIKSATNAGVFGYTNGATIKNLNIKNAEISLGGGRSTTNMGILVGRADETIIEDIKIDDTKILLAGNSSAEIALGTLVGYSESSSFKNIVIKNTDMEISKSRLLLSAGLVAGVLKGEGVQDAGYFVENVLASGSIRAVMYYPSTEGYTYIGGFAGNIGAIGLIKDSAVVSDILITKDPNSIHTNDFVLAVGGFIGFNDQGSINIENCAAVADINAYAGLDPNAKPEEAPTATEANPDEANPDESKPEENKPEENKPLPLEETKMSNKEVYIGGFVGRAKWLFNKIANSAYVEKNTGIKAVMLPEEIIKEEGKDDVTKKLLYLGSFAGQTTSPEKLINNITPETVNPDYSIFTKAIQEIINNKAL